MPVIQGERSVPISGVIDNLFTGSQFEFLPFNAMLAFGLVGDANASDLRIDVYSGQDTLAEDMQPSAQNRIPVFPDDFTLDDVAVAGERIKARVRNLSAAAARTIFFALKVTPME